MTSPQALSNRQIMQAALLTLLGFLASGVLGLVRTYVLATSFGTSEALDAFYAAQRLPELIFVLVAGGALGSSFIPVFARRAQADEQAAWRLAGAVMTLAALAAALLGVGVALVAQPLVEVILLPGRSPAAQALTADLVRWMMVTPCIFAISGLLMGILQSQGRFLLPSIAISMNNIGIILGALFIAPALPPLDGVGQVGALNVYGLALGAILSAALHLAVQLPQAIRLPIRPRLLWNADVRQVLLLMLPRVLGVAVVQLNFVVNIALSSGMAAGSLVALNTAFTLMFTALGIIAQSVGSALFPSLSAAWAQGDLPAYQDRLNAALRGVLFLSIPALVAFISFGVPLLSLFEQGEWTRSSTEATAWALALYAIGIPGFALLEILARAFYALEDTWTPVGIGMAAMVANIIGSFALAALIGRYDTLEFGSFGGLALANSLTTLAEAGVLWALLRRRIGAVGGAGLGGMLWRSSVAAALMGGCLLLLQAAQVLGGVALALVGALGGAALFFGVAALLGVDEARRVPLAILRRVRR